MIFDYIADLIIGFIFSIFFISAGFVLALNFKTLYYNDINLLNIEQSSSLDNELIKDNYDSLVSYMQPNAKGDLILPNFTLSESATKHFYEIKNLYKIVYLLAAFSGLMCIVIIILKVRNADHQFLFISSIIASLIPLAILLGALTQFNTMFNRFCSYIFADYDWQLSPTTDPVATILPNKFLQHSSIAIFSFAFICGLCLFVIWKGLKNKFEG